jgi:carbon storage regulator
MLVLSRKKNESILFGEDIELKVIAIDGNRVRLGIQAPNSVRIIRGELLPAIEAEFEHESKEHTHGEKCKVLTDMR